MMKQLIKKNIGLFFSQPFILNKMLEEKGCILMFHRVLPDHQKNTFVPQSSIVIYQSEFDQLLNKLKDNFEVVSLPYLLKNYNNNENAKNNKPLLAISFDDGWSDNIYYALPILKKHKIQASLFIANQFISSQKKFWWTALSEYLSLNKGVDIIVRHLDLTEDQQLLLNKVIHNKSTIDELIISLKNCDQQQLAKLADILVDSEPEKLHADGMTWDELQIWLDAGQHIGAHTLNHFLLTHITEELANKEILESYQDLCLRFGSHKVLDIFCYPNGNNNKNLQLLVQSLGFNYALGTEPRLLEKRCNPYNLPRFNINSSHVLHTEKLFFQIAKSWFN